MTARGRHSVRTRRSLLRRVALLFAGAVAVTALALALSAYYLTKSAQDDDALTSALNQSRLNLFIADDRLPAEPTPTDYQNLLGAFEIRGDFGTLVEAGDETYVIGLDVTREQITDALATKVAEDRIGYQTIEVAGQPTIVVGGQLRSGALALYFFYPQGGRLAELARLRNILATGGVVLALLGAVAGYGLARGLTRRVRAASKAAVQMSQGDLSIRLPAGDDEFGILALSFNEMAGNLQTKVLDLEAGQTRERRFVADVAHELRTPVSALVGEASLLKTRLEANPGDASPEVSRLVALVNNDISRLRQLVDDLLEISRLEAQAAETVIEPVDLGWFLGQLVRAHGWSETVRIGGGASAAGPLIVYADRRRVERIVVNLVENALLHGAAPVTVTPLRTADPASGELVAQIAVTDSGPGIPPQHLPHVFDRFYKADPSRSSGRGSGLGLAIARENARLLGGDLTAANVPRGGARFVVTLPASEQSAPGYPAGADETDGAPSGS